MRHDHIVEGYAYRLRPVAVEDAGLIVNLRTNPKRNAFIHSTRSDVGLQERWIGTYFERAGDYYLVIESRADAQPQGTIGLYAIDEAQRSGEAGRWIIQEDSMAALESVILLYRLAFDVLDLSMVYSRTALANQSAVRFHDAFGLVRHAVLPGFLKLDGGTMDAVEHRMTREIWDQTRFALEEKAARVARLLAR